MEYILFLPDRPFNAIKAGTKIVEGRTITKHVNIPFNLIKTCDSIVFHNETTNATLTTGVRFIHHYPTVRKMLETEGVENVLSSEPKTIDSGINSYNSLTSYKENILKYGIYAIGIKLVKNRL